MRTGCVCVRTQSSIHGSSTHIRGQERPGYINKEAKQITLASSQCVCKTVHANAHTSIQSVGVIPAAAVHFVRLFISKYTLTQRSKQKWSVPHLSPGEWVLIQYGWCSAVCLCVCRQSERWESEWWFNPPPPLHPTHYSCLRHWRKYLRYRINLC